MSDEEHIRSLCKRHEMAPDTGMLLMRIATDVARRTGEHVELVLPIVANELAFYALDCVVEQEGLSEY